MIFELLRLFDKTLTSNNKYSLCFISKLPELIQIVLSKKQKIFSEFFDPFLKCASNFTDFQKQDDPHSLCSFEVPDCESHG